MAIPALNRTTNPKTNHNTNPTYRNYPTNPNETLLTLTNRNVTHPNKPYLPYWIYHNKVAILVDKLITYTIE